MNDEVNENKQDWKNCVTCIFFDQDIELQLHYFFRKDWGVKAFFVLGGLFLEVVINLQLEFWDEANLLIWPVCDIIVSSAAHVEGCSKHHESSDKENFSRANYFIPWCIKLFELVKYFFVLDKLMPSYLDLFLCCGWQIIDSKHAQKR